MFYISLGWMYGANVTAGEYARNVFTVALGNIIGGSFLVGFSEYYLYIYSLLILGIIGIRTMNRHDIKESHSRIGRRVRSSTPRLIRYLSLRMGNRINQI
jgi:hypothetical protein